MDSLTPLTRELRERSVRYVLIGVGGANLYAPDGAALFTTKDRDLFLPGESDNLLRCWAACEAASLQLWSGDEPLDRPRDGVLADRVIERRALTRASAADLEVDLTLVMAGFDFETVWDERRRFIVDGVEIPVARLLHIVTSKHAAGRDKDRLFLATHRDALEQLLKREESGPTSLEP
jgi:hypothetical protein